MNSLPPALPQDFDYPAPVSPNGSAKTDPKIRVQKFLTALRRFWWVPLLTLILCVGAAVTLFFYMPPIFVSYAQLWETEKLKLPDGATFTEDPQTYFGTLNEVLKSGKMKNDALQLIRLSGTNVPTADPEGKDFDVQITVAQAPRSSVFRVEADSPNPAFTPAYLNALISAYREYKRTVRKEVSGDTLASIAEQVKRLELDLQGGQDKLAEFEKSNNYAVLQEENTIAASYLAKMKTQLADYQLENRLLDAVALEKDSSGSAPPQPSTFNSQPNTPGSLFDSLQNSSDTGDGQAGRTALPQPSTLNPQPNSASPATGNQNPYQEVELLTLQHDKLSKYLRPEHPKMVKLNEDIARTQSIIDFYQRQYQQQNQQQMATARQALQIRITNEVQSIAEWESKVAYANSRIAEFERLKVDVSRKEALYERLVSLLQNVDIGRSIDQETLTVLEPASPSKRSYKEAIRNLAMSAVGGLGLGLGFVFLVSWRDDRIISLVEVCDKITDNVVGQVPDIRQLKNGAPLAILEHNDDRHMYVESFRSLRSALLYITSEAERPKVLLITSAMPSEGKSTIATNLARVLAMGGARVLLVDGDLRKGRLHDLLGLQSKPGLADLLLQTADLDEIVQATSLPGLSFLPRGANLRNSGDLFLSPAFDQFLARVRQQYDHVLIDSSPVFATDDATTVAPKMDGTLLVVRSHFSRAGMVKEALELLYQRQARVLGLVVNRANSSDHSYHYYKHADYYAAAGADEVAK